jgi:ribose transport system permease protein
MQREQAGGEGKQDAAMLPGPAAGEGDPGQPPPDGAAAAAAMSAHGPAGRARAAGGGPPGAGPVRRLAAALARHGVGRYGVVGVWALMCLVFAVATPSLFLTVGTLQTIFSGQVALVFLAMALVVVLAVGEFDLSIAAILGLSATMVPVLVVVDHWSTAAAVVFAMVASTLAGLINGFVVVKLGVNAIVTTLGMSTLLLGIELQQTQLSSVTGLPAGLAKLSNAEFLGLPVSFYYGLVIAIVLMYVLFATPLGRHMTFVGANREVARLAGVRVARIRLGAYTFSGFICGLGGVILVAGLGGFDPTTSADYLMPAFAAAFLGSSMIVPGRFNPIGAFLAIYFLETGIVGLELLGFTGWISDVFFGAALIIAVLVSTTLRRRIRRA